jgi:two-component system, OmpR family, copper resistance phosphate regulon response regulator CusR
MDLMRILVSEDQVKMAEFLKKGLSEVGYSVDLTENGLIAERLAIQNPYDLVILDVMLPEQDGIETAKNLRNQGYQGPILMLTALSTTKDKITGLDAGADDYITKPYSFEELLARVRALLRRKAQDNGVAILKYGNLELDLIRRLAKRDGREISLTTKEFTLLEYLLRNAEQPLTRTFIAEQVWNLKFDNDSNVIDVYINLLRKKIDLPSDRKLIHTVVGTGYVLRETH